MPEALAEAASLISQGMLHIPVENFYTLAEAAVAQFDSYAGTREGAGSWSSEPLPYAFARTAS